MPKFISCGDISLYMLLPLAAAIITFFHFLILQYLFQNGLRHQLFLYSALNSLGKTSMGFLYLILLIQFKKRRTIHIFKLPEEQIDLNFFRSSNSSSSTFRELKQNNKTYLTYICLIVSAILHYIFFILDNSFRFIKYFALAPEEETQTQKISSKYNGFLYIILRIFVLSPLNKVILNYPLYKHNILAIGLVLFGSFIYLLNFIKDGVGTIDMVFFLFGFLLNCFQIVFEKYLMQNKNFSVFQILFHEGYIELIVNTICFLFFSLIQGTNITFMGFTVQNYSEIIPAIQKNSICIVFLLLYFGEVTLYEMTIEMIINYLNPNYIYLFEIFSGLPIWTIEMITLSVSVFFNNYKWNNLLGYFIVIIGGLIYNELIIIYLCGLEKNTKREIQKRAKDLDEEIGMIEELTKNNYQKIIF